MNKKRLLIFILLVALVMALTACAPDYKWGPLDTSAADNSPLLSNGGSVVSYKGYIYFINGTTSTYEAENVFGEVVFGSVCRIAASKLDTVKENDFGTDEYAEALGAEVLAPKAVFSSNTSDARLNGIYIFNDRLFYTTPSDTLASDGSVRNTMLDIMSVKLDGTDTKRVYTLGSNSLSVGMFETDGDAYALFVDGDKNLVSLNLFDGTETKVDEKVTSSAVDMQSGSIVYTKDVITEKENQGTEITANYNELYVVKAGQTASAKIMTGQHADGQDVSYDFDVSIASASDGFVYFNLSSDAHGRDGMYRISESVEDKRLADATRLYRNVLSGAVAYQDGFVYYNSTSKYVQFVKDGQDAKNLYYTASSPSFKFIQEGTLYFEMDSALWSISLNGESNPDTLTANKLTDKVNATSWLNYDILDGKVFYMYTDNDVYLHFSEMGEAAKDKEIKTYVLALADEE
ncbi:MAG: hypothetical protein ACI4M1_01180 [Christensenellales bacterium]